MTVILRDGLTIQDTPSNMYTDPPRVIQTHTLPSIDALCSSSSWFLRHPTLTIIVLKVLCVYQGATKSAAADYRDDDDDDDEDDNDHHHHHLHHHKGDNDNDDDVDNVEHCPTRIFSTLVLKLVADKQELRSSHRLSRLALLLQ
ncbi:hypothetical protein PoB_006716700 [Plakobranchus ocellatus]|uniref:Uncharacterized protein n=1 Tax=Plakobranchus ocellatus TaxID=259542 RepID=A0AAV4D942_9GAST|nr:hypothetical protein PoB_006716700 [Plakobranchus ocellatus]